MKFLPLVINLTSNTWCSWLGTFCANLVHFLLAQSHILCYNWFKKFYWIVSRTTIIIRTDSGIWEIKILYSSYCSRSLNQGVWEMECPRSYRVTLFWKSKFDANHGIYTTHDTQPHNRHNISQIRLTKVCI